VRSDCESQDPYRRYRTSRHWAYYRGFKFREWVTGSHPNFAVTMIGNAASATLPGVFDIDYNYDIRLDFCARTGSLSGINEGYPSYTVRFERETVLDWHQETLLSLLGDGEIPAPLRGKLAPDEFVWVRAGLTLRCSEAMGRMSAPVDPIKKPPGQALGGASSSGHPGLAPKQFLELVR